VVARNPRVFDRGQRFIFPGAKKTKEVGVKKVITAARETGRLTPAGELERIAVYEFTLDGLGPFTYEVPLAEDTREKLEKAMAEKEKILSGLTEKK